MILTTIVLTLGLARVSSGQGTPSGSCQLLSGPPVEVTCNNVTLASVLPLLPSNVQKLTVRSSNIDTLYTNTFEHLGLGRLTELYLMDNTIALIQLGAFAGLPSLEVLDLSGNQLKEVNDTALIAIETLQVLNLANNALEDVPSLDKVPNLQVLNLNLNHLQQLPCQAFLFLTKLKVLHVQDNQIAAVLNCSFEGLTGLEELSLKWNPIANVETGAFGSTSNLLRFDFSYNLLTALPDRLLEPVGETLQQLTLANSNLASVPVWGNLTSLRHLDISANELKSIEPRAFDTLTSLEKLFIIDMVTLESVGSNAFDNLGQLRSLVMRGNKNLKAFPAGALSTDQLQRLQEIFLNNNGIQKFTEALIGAFGSLPRLEEVAIKDNPIHCDCSALYLREFLLTSNASWARDWRADGVKCSTPVNFRAVAVVDVPPRDLTCDPPQVEVPNSLDLQVQEGAQMKVSLLTYGGIPSSVWITPLGITVKPNEVKLGFYVSEVVAEDNSVTTTILKDSFSQEDAGPYTAVSTNANSGTSITFTVTLSSEPPQDEDVMAGENAAAEDVMAGKNAAAEVIMLGENAADEDVMNLETLLENHNVPESNSETSNLDVRLQNADFHLQDDEDNLATTPTLRHHWDRALRRHQHNSNMIGVTAAMFIMILSVVVVYFVVRRKKRDAMYRPLPRRTITSIMCQAKAPNYGTYKMSSNIGC